MLHSGQKFPMFSIDPSCTNAGHYHQIMKVQASGATVGVEGSLRCIFLHFETNFLLIILFLNFELFESQFFFQIISLIFNIQMQLVRHALIAGHLRLCFFVIILIKTSRNTKPIVEIFVLIFTTF